MKLYYLGAGVGLTLVLATVAACSSSAPRSGSGFGDGDGGTGNSNGGGGPIDIVITPDAGGQAACVPAPGNYDFPGNNCDDDGDGKVDNAPADCDATVAVGADAAAFAKALGLCASANVLSAEYLRGSDTTERPNDSQHGVLKKFGNILKPREGAALGVISTGFAREFNALSGQNPFNKSSFGLSLGETMQRGPNFAPLAAKVPAGFPKNSAGCPTLERAVFDAVNVKLKLKAPTNAKGFKFDFNFFSAEWPSFVCSAYNDAFIAYLTSKGKKDNISFDAKGNPVSVNLGFLDRCTPKAQVGCCTKADQPGCKGTPLATSVCAGGPAELAGTGFGVLGSADPASGDAYCKDETTGGAATGWLTTSAPIEPGEEFTLEFMVWDTSDGVLDSSVLLDNFQWVQGDVQTETIRPN
jgi:hypothetical protein